jgi:hypothetical protein
VWEGERGRERGEVESECVRVWKGERGRNIWGTIKCVCDSVGGFVNTHLFQLDPLGNL